MSEEDKLPVLVGACLGKETKSACCATKIRVPIEEPVSSNGFVYTGDCPEYGDYTYGVLDFDVPPELGKKIEWAALHPWFSYHIDTTDAVTTGKGGLHLKFWVRGKHPEIGNLQGGKAGQIQQWLKDLGVVNVDIRGHNGKIIAPGSRFTGESDHFAAYEKINDLPPRVISIEEWNQILSEIYTWAQKGVKTKKIPINDKKDDEKTSLILPMSIKMEIVDLLSKSPLFPDDGARHTRHGQILNLAIIFYNYHVAQEDAELILSELEDLVRTKEGGPNAEKIVRDVYEKGYGVRKASAELKSVMDVKIDPKAKGRKANRTWWGEFVELLERASEGFRKKMEKAKEAAERALKRVMERDEEEDFLRQIVDQFMDYEAFYIKEYHQWACYVDGVYHIDDHIIKKAIKEVIGEKRYIRSINTIVREVLEYLSSFKVASIKEFLEITPYLVIENGVWDCERHVLNPHASDLKTLIKAPIRYNPQGMPPNFKKFVNSLTRDDRERERFCQILKGILENRFPKEKEFIIFHGRPNTGKSMTIRLLQQMLGVENTHSQRLSAIGSRFAAGSFVGKRFVFDPDAASDSLNIESTEFLKKLTGGDVIPSERKGRDPVNIKVSFTFAIACNAIPQMPTDDDIGSIGKRAIFFYFKNQHENNKRNREFEEELMKEKDAIASYLFNIEAWDYIPQIPTNAEDVFYIKFKDATDYWRCLSNPTYGFLRKYNLRGDSGTLYDAKEIIKSIRVYERAFGIYQSDKQIWRTLRKEIGKKGGEIVRKQKDGIKRQIIKDVKIDGCVPYRDDDLTYIDVDEILSSDVDVDDFF